MKSKPWTDEELRDAVTAYIDMLNKQHAGIAFIKQHYYQKLSKKHGRTAKSFEYRMENISYVFYLMKKTWLDGLKPAKNIGPTNLTKLEQMIAAQLHEECREDVEFEASVHRERNNPRLEPPQGNKHPQKSTGVTPYYQRDPKVKAWVLNQAKGICEACRAPAPFLAADGFPYLEVHHLIPLADGGADTITNAVALCPNCHRKIHYGIDRETMTQRLRRSLNRLTPPKSPPSSLPDAGGSDGPHVADKGRTA